MTVDTLIMLSGAFVAILPFLGFPNSWDDILFLVAGICVIALGIIVRRRGQRLVVHREKRASHVVEHVPERTLDLAPSSIDPRREEVEHESA